MRRIPKTVIRKREPTVSRPFFSRKNLASKGDAKAGLGMVCALLAVIGLVLTVLISEWIFLSAIFLVLLGGVTYLVLSAIWGEDDD